MYEYFDKYDEDDFIPKGRNRDKKIDKKIQNRQDFMKINGRGLLTDVLPAMAKRAQDKGKDKRK